MPARGALQEALWNDRPAGVRRAVADAIVAGRAGAPELVRSLGTALAAALSGEGAPDDALALVRALAVHRSKDAARVLVEQGVESSAAPVREAALAALSRLSGRKELTGNAKACAEWWSVACWLSDEEWERQVTPAAEVAAAPESPAERLAVLYRRLHAATAESGRDALLVEMLESPEPPVRLAGFELIMLSLVNAKPVGEGPAAAAARCLEDESSAIRAEAARTIELLGRPADLERLARRLEVESDENAAASMLRAGAHRPTPALFEPAIRWLDAGAPGLAASAGAEALDALRRAGNLTARQEDQAREALQPRLKQEPDGAMLRLAAGLGLLEEVSSVALGPDRARAKQVAPALAESEAGLSVLLSAAAEHTDLFDEVAAGITRFRASADGYAALASLPAPSPEARAAALERLTRSMDCAELRRLIETPWTPGRTEAILGPLVSPEFFSKAGDLPERVELALELARARIELRRPGDALATLAILPGDWQGARTISARVTALVCLGRYAEADAAAPSSDENGRGALTQEQRAEAWLLAAENCGSTGLVKREFEERFESDLSAEQRARWNALQAE